MPAIICSITVSFEYLKGMLHRIVTLYPAAAIDQCRRCTPTLKGRSEGERIVSCGQNVLVPTQMDGCGKAVRII